MGEVLRLRTSAAWLLPLLLMGCVEAAPGVNGGETGEPEEPEQPEELYDCADCSFEGFSFGNAGVNGSFPDRVRCIGVAPNTNPFALSIGVWSRNGGIVAGGVRCVDFEPTWDTDAFQISPGNDVRDLSVIGSVPFMIPPEESRCAEGFVSGFSFQTSGENVVSVQALCADFRVEVQENGGELSATFRRTGLAPGPMVPADAACGSDCITSEEVCPEGFLAEGFQTKLDELDSGGTSFRGFDVICTPITAQISGM